MCSENPPEDFQVRRRANMFSTSSFHRALDKVADEGPHKGIGLVSSNKVPVLAPGGLAMSSEWSIAMIQRYWFTATLVHSHPIVNSILKYFGLLQCKYDAKAKVVVSATNTQWNCDTSVCLESTFHNSQLSCTVYGALTRLLVCCVTVPYLIQRILI